MLLKHVQSIIINSAGLSVYLLIAVLAWFPTMSLEKVRCS